VVRSIHEMGTTIVIVEQSINVALNLAERAVFMEKGEVRFEGPARELLDRPDILLLDEPTTHLDLTTLETLEAALRGFPGAMLFVSHDRTFLDRLAERLLVIGDGMVQSVAGSYHAYRESRAGLAPAVGRQQPAAAGRGEVRRGGGSAEDKVRPAPAGDEARPRPSASKGSRRQSQPASGGPRHKEPTPEELAAQITTMERELQDLSRVMGDPELYRDAARARQTVKRYEELAAALESLRARLSDGQEGSDA